MNILRFITAGSVDDGKSTLIGRLLYDTNNIKSDVLASLIQQDEGNSEINLAFVTDGLRAERQQGITIDVAYKYFNTANRKFIITDAPGHFEFTKNLVTGASNADLMIVLIDAQHGITDQTRRHSLVASFLEIPQVVVAVNKMDLVHYDSNVFAAIKSEYMIMAEKLGLRNVKFIPISALEGDNVTTESAKMHWYREGTLLHTLESCTIYDKAPGVFCRFATQCIIPTEEGIAFAGKILSGTLQKGDAVVIYPEGIDTTVKKIICNKTEVNTANTLQNVCLYLESNTVATRGDIICDKDNPPQYSKQLDATLCWLDASAPMDISKEYLLRINTIETLCTIKDVLYTIDNNTYEQHAANEQIKVNQFARVVVHTQEMIAYDPYSLLPENGRGILIDPVTYNTAAAVKINA